MSFPFGIQSAAITLAYLDPGTGSFILQVVIAALVGSLFIVQRYWEKITKRVKTLFKHDQPNAPMESADPDQPKLP